MSIAQSLLNEFEQQVAVTRVFLERIPADKLSWKPHEKSMTAGQLAFHLATVPGSIMRAVQNSTAPAPEFASFPQPATTREVLDKLDESIATVKSILPSLDDAKMRETWRLIRDGKDVLAVPRQQFIRDVMFSHWYQHRGQLSVYLRILGVPVPASWGPSADEPPAFARMARSA